MDNSWGLAFQEFNLLVLIGSVVGLLAMIGSLYGDDKERKRVEAIRKKYM